MYHFKGKLTKIHRLNKKNCSGLFTCGHGCSRGSQTTHHQAPSFHKFFDFRLTTEKCNTRAKLEHDRGPSIIILPIKHPSKHKKYTFFIISHFTISRKNTIPEYVGAREHTLLTKY